MLNLHMVGFSDGGKRPLEFAPNGWDHWLADHFIQAARRCVVGIGVVKRVGVMPAGSDEACLWAAWCPAFTIMGNEPDSKPYYHQSSGTPDMLDLDFLTALTRAALATVVTLASGEQLPAEGRARSTRREKR